MNVTRLRWSDIPDSLRYRAEAAVATPLREIASAPAVRDFQRAQAQALPAWLGTRRPDIIVERT